MSRWLTSGMAVAVIVLLAAAANWSSRPAPARAQTAPDVRLRDAETGSASSSPSAGSADASAPLALRLSTATLVEDSRVLADGADVTLLAQPTYVALPGAAPNLLRISPAFTITARDASGRDIDLSPAARLTFIQPSAKSATVFRLERDAWHAVPAVTLGHALIVQPTRTGTYAVFAELPPDWPLRNDLLTAVALNAARLVVDDLATQP
ncbi:MAG: hypothetical protein OXG64_01230 [Chloroflexi bacterium]|nr:hypothetical protein [Chloroflexota bacterium]